MSDERSPDNPSVDGYLQSLIYRTTGYTGQQPLGLPIMLNVNGALIGGVLISEREYFEGMATFFERLFERTRTEAIQEAREEYEARGEQRPREEIEAAMPLDTEELMQMVSSEDEALEGQPRYIHLREARITDASASSGMYSTQWWRGRLDAVDGFTIGGFGK